MFDLNFINTKYGNVLLNPIGDNILILDDETSNTFSNALMDMMITGNAILDFRRK